MAKLEEIYNKVNPQSWPKFQLFAIFIISSTLLTNGGVPLLLTFLTSTKGWKCRSEHCNQDIDLCSQNLTDSDWFSPVSVATDRFLKSFNVYCGYEAYFSFISSLFFVGFMFGIIFGGMMMDRFGRKKVLIITTFIYCLNVILHASSKTDFRVFGFFHTITGLIGGIQGTIFIYQQELVQGKLRNFSSQVHNEVFSIGMLYGAMLSAYIDDFTLICIALTIPGLLANLIIMTWLPESPLWLHSKQKTEELNSALSCVAQINKVKYHPDERIDPPLVEKSTVNKNTLRMLFTFSKVTTKCMIILLFSWLTASFCYWGLSFNVGDLIGNLYINQVLICLIDLINRPINYYGVKLFDRVKFLRGCNIGMAISAVVCMMPYEEEIFPSFNLRKISALIGRMIADLYFSTIYLYTAEVLPTVSRATGLGLCSSVARIGSVIAPFVIVANTISPLINFFAILFLSCVCFVGYGYMPETRDRLLPETMGDMKELVEGKVEKHLKVSSEDIKGLLDSDSDDETVYRKGRVHINTAETVF